MAPTQHHLSNVVTIDGVRYALPRGYLTSDGKTIVRDDRPAVNRLVPRTLLPFEGGFAISEGVKVLPLRRLKAD